MPRYGIGAGHAKFNYSNHAKLDQHNIAYERRPLLNIYFLYFIASVYMMKSFHFSR